MTTPETPRRPHAGTPRLGAKDAVAHGAAILPSLGVPEDNARLVTESLITADMWVHPSRDGRLRLPWCVARFRSAKVLTVSGGGDQVHHSGVGHRRGRAAHHRPQAAIDGIILPAAGHKRRGEPHRAGPALR